ncbi:MAG: hypothetical protein WAM89_08070 [Terriglobales bacterium]
MKTQLALILLLVGASLTGETGILRGQTYSSYVTATQIHATANHWGNSMSHLLIDTVTITVPVAVSRASWTTEGAYTSVPSRINSYDVGLHCLISPGPDQGGCEPGRLYTHTGPLLSLQTHPQCDSAVSVPLVADANTVCTSYPCVLPVGTYSLTTASSETPTKTLGIWGDGSYFTRGGAEFHLGNSFNDAALPYNVMIAGYVQEEPAITTSGGNTQVTLTVTMLDGQPVSGSPNGFAPGMRILVAGLTSGTGGPSDPCNGYNTVDDNVTSTTITYTIQGSYTCALEGKTDGSDTCNGIPAAEDAPGYGCVGAGLQPMLGKLIADQQNPNGQPNGYYCFVDGPAWGCQRNNFVGPAGPQKGAHSLGFMIY